MVDDFFGPRCRVSLKIYLMDQIDNNARTGTGIRKGVVIATEKPGQTQHQ
jgi:hypothetical protein